MSTHVATDDEEDKKRNSQRRSQFLNDSSRSASPKSKSPPGSARGAPKRSVTLDDKRPSMRTGGGFNFDALPRSSVPKGAAKIGSLKKQDSKKTDILAKMFSGSANFL